MIAITVTDAARGFSDLINRVRYRGESAILMKAGKPVACVTPVKAICTGAELAKFWPALHRLGVREATKLEKELSAARKKLRMPDSRWE
jgi:prevent-host-death family protein